MADEQYDATIRIGGDASGAKKALGEAEAAAKKTADTVERELTPAELAAAQAILRASDAIGQFGKQVESNNPRFGKFAVAAKIALDQTQRELDELAKQGVITGAQVGEAMSRLNAEYSKTASGAGKLKASMADAADDMKLATREAGELSGQLSSLEDIAAAINPQLASFAAKAVALQAAFGLVEQAGRQVAEVIGSFGKALGASNDEVRIATERIGDLFTATGLLRVSINSVAEGAKSATKEIGDFFRDREEETRKAIEGAHKYAAAMREAAEAARLESESDRIFGDAEEYIKKANAVVDSIRRQRDAHQLNAVEIKASEDAIRELLDGAERLGEQPPAQVQKLANEFGVLSTAAEAASVAAVSAMDQITVEAKKRTEELAALRKKEEEEVAAARKRIDERNKAQQAGSPGQIVGESKDLAEAKKNAAELREEIAGIEAKPIFSAEDYERLPAAKKELADLELNVQGVREGLVGASQAATQLASGAAQAAQSFGAVDDNAQAIDDLLTSAIARSNKWADAAAAAADEVQGAEVQIGRAADGTVLLTNVTEGAGEAGEIAWSRNADGLVEMSNAAGDASGVVEDLGSKVSDTAKALTKANELAEEHFESEVEGGKETVKVYDRIIERLREMVKLLARLVGGSGTTPTGDTLPAAPGSGSPKSAPIVIGGSDKLAGIGSPRTAEGRPIFRGLEKGGPTDLSPGGPSPGFPMVPGTPISTPPPRSTGGGAGGASGGGDRAAGGGAGAAPAGGVAGLSRTQVGAAGWGVIIGGGGSPSDPWQIGRAPFEPVGGTPMRPLSGYYLIPSGGGQRMVTYGELLVTSTYQLFQDSAKETVFVALPSDWEAAAAKLEAGRSATSSGGGSGTGGVPNRGAAGPMWEHHTPGIDLYNDLVTGGIRQPGGNWPITNYSGGKSAPTPGEVAIVGAVRDLGTEMRGLRRDLQGDGGMGGRAAGAY